MESIYTQQLRDFEIIETKFKKLDDYTAFMERNPDNLICKDREDCLYRYAYRHGYYDEYLKCYPNGRYSESMNSIVERNYYRECRTESNFQKYLDKYPEGVFKEYALYNMKQHKELSKTDIILYFIFFIIMLPILLLILYLSRNNSKKETPSDCSNDNVPCLPLTGYSSTAIPFRESRKEEIKKDLKGWCHLGSATLVQHNQKERFQLYARKIFGDVYYRLYVFGNEYYLAYNRKSQSKYTCEAEIVSRLFGGTRKSIISKGEAEVYIKYKSQKVSEYAILPSHFNIIIRGK